MLQAYIKQLLLGVLFALCAGLAIAAEPKSLFVEGQDYVRVPNSVRNSPEVAQIVATDPNKVQVLFFFSYGCHGCETFHTPFEKWTAARKKDNAQVVVYRYPVSFNPQWQMLAKLYYVMESLDPSGKLNNAIFTGIHKQGLKLWQEAAMSKFFVQNGYKAKDFQEAYSSFSVYRKMKRADEISKIYKILETPDIIVNGPAASYKLELAKADHNVDKLFKILDYVVKRETKLLNR